MGCWVVEDNLVAFVGLVEWSCLWLASLFFVCVGGNVKLGGRKYVTWVFVVKLK